MQNLISRSASGAIYVFIVIAATYRWPSYDVLALAAIFSFTALYEWFTLPSKVAFAKSKFHFGWLFGLSLLLFLALAQEQSTLPVLDHRQAFPVYTAALALGLAGWLIYAVLNVKLDPLLMMQRFFGLLYIALPLSLLYPLGALGPKILLAVFLLIWVNDSFAYLIGSRWGRHKIAPAISPGKSWEGLIAGLLAGLILAYFFPHLGFVALEQKLWLGLAFIVTLAGTLGDFFESRLKRYYGVKDSGNLLPGHGGILDRIDSLLFVVPAAYFFLRLYFSLYH